MNSDKGIPISMAHPGHRTKKLARISRSLLLVVLTILGIGVGLPSTIGSSPPNSSSNDTSTAYPSSILHSQSPQTVGANRLSDLSLPKTVVSNVDNMIGASGIIRDSPNNLTLFNSAIRLRLIGGPQSRDELLGENAAAIGSSPSWRIETMAGKSWVPLQPRSNNFTILGTNTTGTFVVRTMQVGNSGASGILTISYVATSEGPLRWDLQFSASNTAQYRMVFDWKNTTRGSQLSASSKSFRTSYGRENYTMSWTDVPSSLNTTATASSGEFLLVIDLGLVASGSELLVDPTIVDSNATPLATAYGSHYGSQRKVFYEAASGYYWLFYYNGSGTVYRNSHDGTQWSAPQAIPNGWPYSHFPLTVEPPSVYNVGHSIMVAEGMANSTDVTLGGVRSASAYYINGTIHGSSITWANTVSFGKAWTTQACTETNSQSCMVVGTRYVSIGLSSDGRWAFSLDWYAHVGSNCARSVLYVAYMSSLLFNITDTGYHCTNPNLFFTDDLGSALLAADPHGLMRIIYQNETYAQNHYNGVLASRTIDTRFNVGPVETIVTGARSFSAVQDGNFGVHVVYDDGADSGTSYAYRGVNDPGWTYSTDIFSGGYDNAQLTLDQSTNTLYAVATSAFGAFVIVMKSKAPAQHWFDSSNVFPITGNYLATYLTSDYASASATNSSQITMIWTDRYTSTSRLMFASIPIDTAWSPYASPSDPWDGNGLAPYGQYFANLNEYVSPSTGMLTVRQTELALPGRGLNLDLTIVYTEPHSFLGGAAYNFENYSWAPMGLSWQLEFPWLTKSSAPLYIHLWDGEGYRIPYSFWTNPAPTRFENHEGENFLLVRNSTGVFLYDRSGIAYIFDPSHSNRLKTIIDTNGNKVQFGYNTNNQIANITDTIQRIFQFCYSGGLLSNINQTSGSCTGNSGSLRGVVFKYSGSSLTKVNDSAGRTTNYTYNAFGASQVSAWLISRVTYPTGEYTNYTYGPSLMGTQATSYRVSKQYVSNASTSNSYIRCLNYLYTNGAGDEVSNSTVVTNDGSTSQPVTYTSYSFSFAGVSWNVSNNNHNFVHGVQRLFGVHGEVPRNDPSQPNARLH